MSQVERRAAAREAMRKKQLAMVPSWYRPWLHLAGTTGTGVFALVLGLTQLEGVHPLELLAVPITFVIANLFEWHVHRNQLHRRRWPFTILYDRHTPVHHQAYQYGDMEIRDPRELRIVLIPTFGIAGALLAAAPFAHLVGIVITPNAGWLTLMTAGMYLVMYELTHLAYHLPAQSFIGRRSLVRRLREHHARHHDPRLMTRYNFNVTVPLWDCLLHTRAPSGAARAEDD